MRFFQGTWLFAISMNLLLRQRRLFMVYDMNWDRALRDSDRCRQLFKFVHQGSKEM